MGLKRFKKEEFQFVINDYKQLIGLKQFRKQSCISNIANRIDIQNQLDVFKRDYPKFSHYKYRDIVYVLIMSDTLEQCLDVPICKYCGKLCAPKSYMCSYKTKSFRNNCYDLQCSRKSVSDTYKNTCRQIYGVDNISQLDSIKQKKCDAAFKKYGVSNVMKSAEVVQKLSESIFQKYGVRNISQLDEIKKKKMETVIEHYGSVKNLMQQTIYAYCRKFGVENSSQLSWIKDKKCETFMKHYGVDNIFKQPEMIQYIKDYWKDRPEEYKQIHDKVSESLKRSKSKINHYGKGSTGVFEFDILNDIEKQIGIKIYRQVGVIQYYLDGYLDKYNIVIEYDEHEEHSKKKDIERDILRQKEIVDYINCTFIRIREYDWICDPDLCIQKIKDAINVCDRINNPNNLQLVLDEKGRYRIHKILGEQLNED